MFTKHNVRHLTILKRISHNNKKSSPNSVSGPKAPGILHLLTLVLGVVPPDALQEGHLGQANHSRSNTESSTAATATNRFVGEADGECSAARRRTQKEETLGALVGRRVLISPPTCRTHADGHAAAPRQDIMHMDTADCSGWN